MCVKTGGNSRLDGWFDIVVLQKAEGIFVISLQIRTNKYPQSKPSTITRMWQMSQKLNTLGRGDLAILRLSHVFYREDENRTLWSSCPLLV